MKINFYSPGNNSAKLSCRLALSCLLILSSTGFCLAEEAMSPKLLQEPKADQVITLLFTNDVESAYDPIPAFWLDDLAMIGGIAEMTTLIEEIRQTQPNVFLFDSI